jgi:hypothetical protein
MSNQYGGEISDKFRDDVRIMLKIPEQEHHKIYTALENLRKKYNDQKIVDEIFSEYKEVKDKIHKASIKIKDKIMKKHPYATSIELIDKIKRYSKKYGFDDYEVKMITDLVLYEKNTPLHGQQYPYTPLSKALGYVPQTYSYSTGTMTVEGPQVESLNAILTINRDFKELHSQVHLQSLVYESVDINAIVGSVSIDNINIYSYIDPVIAALFLPKIRILDERIILASIAKIIANRKEGLPIGSQPEMELYDDICRDPVASQCTTSHDEPFTDLLNRCNVQTSLWNAILHLRQGKYYVPGMNNFLFTLDRCKNNSYDAPEFTYVKDIGNIVQKLFGCFSLRPIYVTTESIPTLVSNNMLMTSNPTTSFNAPIVTTVPMIIVKLPLNNIYNSITQKVDLKDSLVSQQTYSNGHFLEKKIQKVSYCREILVFYVPRKNLSSQTYKYSQQFTIATLPVSTTSLEKLNDTSVIVHKSIPIGNDVFCLRSIVVVETKTSQLLNNEPIIVGSGALIIPPYKNDDSMRSFTTEDGECKAVLYYSPLGLFENKNTHQYGKVSPIGLIPYSSTYKDTISCIQYASTNGTVFVYHADRKEQLRNFGLNM